MLSRGPLKSSKSSIVSARRSPIAASGTTRRCFPPPRGEMLFAADAAVEAVHFDRRFCTLSQAVQKLVTSNVSDIFAMGGSPLSIVFTAALPPGCASADVDAIIDGLERSCTQYEVKLVGGDTVLEPPRVRLQRRDRGRGAGAAAR